MKAQKLKNKKAILASLLSGIILVTGCASSAQASKSEATKNEIALAEQVDVKQNALDNVESILNQKIKYTEQDEYIAWADASYTSVDLNDKNALQNIEGLLVDGNVLKITAGGIYVLSGEWEGSILIDADKEDVRLVMNQVNIQSDEAAAIEVYRANRVTVSLEKGTENSIGSNINNEIVNADGDEITAAVFSKSDLFVNGEGSLTINSNKDGIAGLDNLFLLSGQIEITADDGIVGENSVQINNAILKIEAQGDGIKANNENEQEQGYVIISGGKIEISAGDDGIKGEQQLLITDGDIDILKSVEGLESMDLILAGGDINITSSDDAVNAAGKDSGNQLAIYGGKIQINSEGDGLDANGSIVMTDGALYINGPVTEGNGAMDYDEEFKFYGGDLFVTANAGMVQTPSETTKAVLSVNFKSMLPAGSVISLINSNGETIAELNAEKSFQNVIFSNENMKSGEEYQLMLNGKEVTSVSLSDGITSINEDGSASSNAFGGMQNGQRPPEPPGGMQNGQRPPEPPGGFSDSK